MSDTLTRQDRARQQQHELRTLVRVSTVVAVTAGMLLTAVGWGAVLLEIDAWPLLFAYLWFLLIVPPAIALALSGLAALLGWSAADEVGGGARACRLVGGLLAQLGIGLVAIEVLLIVGCALVVSL